MTALGIDWATSCVRLLRVSHPAARLFLGILLSGMALRTLGQTPVVTITSPANGASIAGPTKIPLEVSASSPNVTVASVTFYQGVKKIGTATAPPFSFNWTNAPVGTYSVTATATDSLGHTGAASPAVSITIVPDQAPTVAMTLPADGTSVVGPTTVPLSATANAILPGVTIASVAFWHENTKIGTVKTPPYNFNWTKVQPNTYSVFAVATDSVGKTTPSAPVGLTVLPDQPPTVTFLTPTDGSTAVGPATIVLSAIATPAANETIVKVVYTVNGSPLATETHPPYKYTWTKVQPGSYAISAVATDNLLVPGPAATVGVTVSADQAPSVTVLTPLSGATYAPQSTIGLTASATTTEAPPIGIASVTYSQNGNKLATVTTPPYQYAWSKPGPGNYSITATAKDTLGAVSPGSAPVSITVTSATTSSVKLTSSAGTKILTPPATVTLTATPVAPAGVSSVSFYAGNTLLGTALASPYQFTWNGAPEGFYYLSAIETDTLGASITSSSVGFRADTPPNVVLTNPPDGSVFNAPATIDLAATVGYVGKVTKVEFYSNVTTLLGSTTIFPYELTLTAVPVGTYSLTAKAYDSFGVASTSASVGVQVVVKQPPTITLSPPSGGLVFGSTANVSLSFTTTAGSTSVTKVVIYRGSSLVATLTSPSSGSTWTFSEPNPLPVGKYTYFAAAYDQTGSSVNSTPVTVTVAYSLPYITDFELGDGFTVGPLDGQAGWYNPQGIANVSTNDFYSGSQSVELPAGTPVAVASTVFAPGSGETVVFCDFYAKPVAETAVASSTIFTAEGAQFGFQRSNGAGVLQVFRGDGNGGGTWAPTNYTATLNSGNQTQSWVRLTARLDFTRRAWDLYTNGAMVAADVPFVSSTSSYFSALLVEGDASSSSFIDGIYIGADNPLPFSDANNDGIDDAWESLYGLNLAVNDRNLNLSGDGIPIVQDYINGTNPFINTKVTPVPVQSGLQMHLRADAAVVTDSNGDVSSWFDQSGLNNNATQFQLNLEPYLTQGAINGEPAVAFNGGGEFMWVPSFLVGDSSAEILAVVRVNPTVNLYNTMWQFGNGLGSGYFNSSHYDDFGTSDGSFYPAQPASETSEYHVYNVSVQANDWIERFNGVQIAEHTGESVSFGTLPSIGAMNGAIAEMIIYNRVLTGQERATVNSFLFSKYNPPGVSVPPALSGLAGLATSPTSVVLTWGGMPAGVHVTASIQRENGTSGGFSEIAEASDVATFTDGTAVPGQTYTYQVSLFNLAGSSGPSNSVTVTTPLTAGPLPPNGLMLWLKADAGTQGAGALSSWMDQSGHNNNAVQPTPALQPQVVLNQVNGQPTVSFNGTNLLNLPGNMMGSAQAGEIIAVAKLGTNPYYSMLFNFGTGTGSSYYNNTAHLDDFGTGDTQNVFEPASETSQHFIYDTAFDSAVGNGTSVFRYNGYAEWTRTNLDSGTIGFQIAPDIGGYGNGSLVGDIAEVIVYNRTLTDQERLAVNQYLNSKYAPTAIVIPPPPVLLGSSVVPTSVILSWSGVPASLHTVASIQRESGTSGGFTQIGQVIDGSGFTDSGVTGGLTYTYQVVLTGIAGSSGASNAVTITTPTTAPPVNIAGLQLWLRADAGVPASGSLASWTDLSGNGNNAAQASAGAQPQVVAGQINGLPVVRFNGSQYLDLPNIMQNAQGGEIIAVAKLASQPADLFNTLWTFGTSGYGSSFIGQFHYDDFGTNDTASIGDPSAVTQYFIYNTSMGGGVSTYRYNGIQTWTRSGLVTSFSAFPVIGSYNQNPVLGVGSLFSGDFAEILVYNRVLTDAERQAIVNYLGTRYVPSGIPVPPVPKNLNAVNSVPGGVTLTWSDPLPGVFTSATIYRETGSSGNFVQVGQVTNEANFTDTGLVAGQTYTYEVSVSSFSGTSGNSSPLQVSIGAPFGTPSDPLEQEPLAPVAGNTTPPTITLTAPADAIPEN